MNEPSLLALIRPRPRRFWPALAILLLITAAAFLGWRAWTMRIQTAQAAEAVQRRIAAEPRPVSATRAELETIKRWGGLQAERSFAWEPLLNALERTAGPDIEVLEFHPDRKGHVVTIKGEALSEQALWGFLDALAGQHSMAGIHLTHVQPAGRGRLATIEFELAAQID